MRTRVATAVLAGSLGLAGVAGAALVSPSAALAHDGSSRVTALKQALTGLVTDGTLTRSQADKVATTLAEQRPHRWARGLVEGVQEDVAATLDLTVEQLRAERAAGRTLAQVAEAQGIEKTALVADLVETARTRLAEAVGAGRITQQRADELGTGLGARITAQVDRVGRGHHRGRGPHGRGETSDSAPSDQPSPPVAPSHS